MSVSIYRNHSLIQVENYKTDSAHVDLLVEALRQKWSFMREKGYAGDYPVEVLRGEHDKSSIINIFKWNSQDARTNARNDSAYLTLEEQIQSLAVAEGAHGHYTEAIRGFQTNFPKVGGVELLKGVCSCVVNVTGVVENFKMSVKNGIVLMHRSPQMDLDGDGKNEMYLKILMHGGELPGSEDPDGDDETTYNTFPGGPIRVEQNFTRPNDGIVKSNGQGEFDFPGTAIWRVYWRIQTRIGPVLTDPDRPLIFGPATVTHYPPVGTNFYSSTGTVDLIHEETGAKVGTITPGELTAFDIVTTKDDEVFADILNTPPQDIFDILEQHTREKV